MERDGAWWIGLGLGLRNLSNINMKGAKWGGVSENLPHLVVNLDKFSLQVSSIAM